MIHAEKGFRDIETRKILTREEIGEKLSTLRGMRGLTPYAIKNNGATRKPIADRAGENRLNSYRIWLGVGSALPASYVSLGQRPHPPIHLSISSLIAISSPHPMLRIVFDESLYGSIISLLYLRWEEACRKLSTA